MVNKTIDLIHLLLAVSKQHDLTLEALWLIGKERQAQMYFILARGHEIL